MADKKTLVNITQRPWTYSDVEFWFNPKDKRQNAIIEFDGKRTRLRAGVLIIKDDTVLLCEDPGTLGDFSLPGGGLDKDETVMEAGKREIQEEVCINLKKVQDTEYDYCECHTEVMPWVKKNVIASRQWYNYYTCLVIGEYESDYLGKIDKVDLDQRVKGTSRWYKISEVINLPSFKKQWKKALIDYGYYVSPTIINEDLTSEAKRYFGTVPLYQSKVGFYINNDGTILDGSGELLGNRNGRMYGQRTIDHRAIAEIMTDISGDDAMLAYMKEGNIRLMPESPGISLMKEPTDDQLRTLNRIISNWRPEEFYVDIVNDRGDNIKSFSYEYPLASQIIRDLYNYFDKRLNEDTRSQLISKSRNVGQYKDTSHGKNRFERKKYSKIANYVKQYNNINMDDFFKKDTLLVKIPVTGETNSYTVSVKLEGVCTEIAKNIKNNNNKLEFKTVLQSLTNVFNTGNVYVSCTCDDFRFNFAHFLILNHQSTEDSSKDPGPGKGIRNPNNDKGIGCKHILLVLANAAWLMKVASVLYQYTLYMDEHQPRVFQKIIFPKLYGMPANEAADGNILPEDTEILDSSEGLIASINDWAKNKGKFKKGSNINPVYANKLAKNQKQPKKQTSIKN